MEIEASRQQTSVPVSIGGGNFPVGGLSPLSEAIWREKAPTEFVGDVSARLTWQDLTVMVTMGDGETQNVLEGLTGYAEPGSLTALMGPSGSGKSTMLDALASRLAANAFLSGTVLLNGRKTKLSFGTAVSIFYTQPFKLQSFSFMKNIFNNFFNFLNKKYQFFNLI